MTIQAAFFGIGGTIETYRHNPILRQGATPDLRRLLFTSPKPTGGGD
jgi:hypothetical protein